MNGEINMALNFRSVKYNTKELIKRIDAKYYIFKNDFSKYILENKDNVIDFDNYIINITDGEHAGQTFVEEGILFLKNSSIKDFDISIYDGFYITEENHNRLIRSELKQENILFTTIGHVGSSAIVPKGFGKANINQNLVKIEVDKKKISPYYIVAYLNSKLAREQVNSLLTGNIQSILTYPKIKSIKIIRPNKDLEIEIEKRYKKALEYNKKAHQIINDIEKYLYLFFDFNLSKKNTYNISLEYLEDRKNLWTPKYYYPLYVNTEKYLQNTFQVEKLEKIADIQKGNEPGSDSYISYLNKKENDVPFIRTSDIYNYQIDNTPDNFVDFSTYIELEQNVRSGDILFTKDGKIGEIAMVTDLDIAIFGSGVERIRLNEYGKKLGLTNEYLFSILKLKEIGLYNSKRYTVTASTIPHLNEKMINRFIIPILDKETIDFVTKKLKVAFKLINEKKKLFKWCQDNINNILSIS
jgi:restriction modification system DNA specificity domain protein